MCVCVCVCVCSYSVNKINPRQGFNNYRRTGLCGQGGLAFILNFTKKKGFRNADLDPSMIGVYLKSMT